MSGTQGQSASDAKPTVRYMRWRTVVPCLVIGAFIGVGAFTFGYGKGHSYLSNDPKTCINCHVMQEHYDSWLASSHRHVATCNDCHLPHDFIGKWVTKADNGFFHSLSFTLQDYHDPIQIKPRNRSVTQGACLSCHGDFTHQMAGQDYELDALNDLNCVHCHFDVGHAFRPFSSASVRE